MVSKQLSHQMVQLFVVRHLVEYVEEQVVGLGLEVLQIVARRALLMLDFHVN
jgi:hypothetical protein